MKIKYKYIAILYAVLAAALYAINIPISKVLLNHVEPTMMASLLYFGAGFGLLLYAFIEKTIVSAVERERLSKKELPYVIAMIILDVAAPVLLMFGLKTSASGNVSLINNFEIVATSIIALVIFKEVISRRLWIAITLVTIASGILSFEGVGSIEFSFGSFFVLAACVCWGFENNCTRMISNKSSVEIVIIKGIFSGLGSLIVAFWAGESFPQIHQLIYVLLLGFVSYGLSIHFYIMAQKDLGAAKTSAYYSIAPFLGVAFSMLFLGERPSVQFYIALIIMLISTRIMIMDSLKVQKDR